MNPPLPTPPPAPARGHTHPHGQGHRHELRYPPLSRPAIVPPARSLLLMGAGPRLALAAIGIAALWALTLWALA